MNKIRLTGWHSIFLQIPASLVKQEGNLQPVTKLKYTHNGEPMSVIPGVTQLISTSKH